MARAQHDYDDIPGTFVFDAERSREGYGINMFCMSLMKDENRKAFKANEAEYLKKFKLTPEQSDAILKRDYNRMLELGGNNGIIVDEFANLDLAVPSIAPAVPKAPLPGSLASALTRSRR